MFGNVSAFMYFAKFEPTSVSPTYLGRFLYDDSILVWNQNDFLDGYIERPRIWDDPCHNCKALIRAFGHDLYFYAKY